MSVLKGLTTVLNDAPTLPVPIPVHAMLVILCQVTEEHAMVGSIPTRRNQFYCVSPFLRYQ